MEPEEKLDEMKDSCMQGYWIWDEPGKSPA